MSESIKVFTWDNAPQDLKDICLATGHMDDAAQGKSPLMIAYSGRPAGLHELFPLAILHRLADTHDSVIDVYDFEGDEGYSLRVYFDEVGTAL